MISISEICKWAGTNPAQRNFREGESILKAGHLISCGKHDNQTHENSIKLIAYCLQTSQLRASPHEITGEISINEKIISISCSCKAGLSEKCKHILATLLYCHRINVNDLEVLSSTDTKCMWKKKHKDSFSNQPLPLEQHECFGKIENNIVITEDLNTIITKLFFDRVPKSAFAKHIVGRHAAIPIESNNNVLSEVQKKIINQIFASQDSQEVMNVIKNMTVKPLNECCKSKLKSLNGDFILICEISTVNYSLYGRKKGNFVLLVQDAIVYIPTHVTQIQIGKKVS